MLPRLLSLGVEGRRVGDLGRASRPHRSPLLGPGQLGGSPRVRSAATFLESRRQEAGVTSCGTAKTALSPCRSACSSCHSSRRPSSCPACSSRCRRRSQDPRRPGTRSRRACCPPPRSAARSAQPPAAAACLSRPSSYEAHRARAPRAPRPKRACRPALARAARAAGAPAHWQAGRALASRRCHR